MSVDLHAERRMVGGRIRAVDRKTMFIVGRLSAESSGVTRIVCDLANALGRQGVPVSVYAADCPGMANGDHLLRPPARFVSAPGRWLGGLSYSPKLLRQVMVEIGSYQVMHAHSLWMLPNHYACLAANRAGVPVIFTAHGIFEPWAIRRSAWKKRIVAWWWQRRDLERAKGIHVNTAAEIAGVRAFGLANPIAIVPNGVDLSPFDSSPPGSALHERYPQLAGKNVMLFLSRLHEKKGVMHLIEAWRALAGDFKDWQLMIVGPDDGAGTLLRAQIESSGLEHCVTLTGSMEGSDKLAAFNIADAFVLPSFSEGFSMAILEAMAARLPVILTPGCNFPEAVIGGAAMQVRPNAVETERGLREVMSMSDQQRREMGQRGRSLVESGYTWDAVATQMIELYRWMAGGGNAPSFVQK